MNVQAFAHRAPSIKYQPKSKRYYIDVGIGSVCLSGADTGGAYSLLEASLAPGIIVPRHTHTREDETYHVLAGELEVVVGEETFVLREGDTLMAPRDIPHQLRNSGNIANHYLLVFSPSGIEGFLKRWRFRPRKTRSLRLSRLQLYFKMSMNSPPTMEFFLAD